MSSNFHAEVLSNIAQMHERNNNLELAEYYYKRSLEIENSSTVRKKYSKLLKKLSNSREQ